MKASQKLEVFLTRGIVTKNNRKHGFVSVNQVNYDIAIADVHDTRPNQKKMEQEWPGLRRSCVANGQRKTCGK